MTISLPDPGGKAVDGADVDGEEPAEDGDLAGFLEQVGMDNGCGGRDAHALKVFVKGFFEAESEVGVNLIDDKEAVFDHGWSPGIRNVNLENASVAPCLVGETGPERPQSLHWRRV